MNGDSGGTATAQTVNWCQSALFYQARGGFMKDAEEGNSKFIAMYYFSTGLEIYPCAFPREG